MNVQKDSLAVLMEIYNTSIQEKTMRINLSLIDLDNIVKHLDRSTIKYCIEYLAGHNYVTYQDHPIDNNICITSIGIDYYIENLE